MVVVVVLVVVVVVVMVVVVVVLVVLVVVLVVVVVVVCLYRSQRESRLCDRLKGQRLRRWLFIDSSHAIHAHQS